MSVSLDEQRFSRVYGDGEPDFIELPTAQPAAKPQPVRRRLPAARPRSNWLADDPRDDPQPPRRLRLSTRDDSVSDRFGRDEGWTRLLRALFTLERNTGYAISITFHLVLLAILSLFLIGGSSPAPRIQIDSSFLEEAPSLTQSSVAELTLPAATMETVPIIGDIQAADGQGMGRFFGDAGAEFFGLRAGGRDFVYIVDCSGSMQGQRFARARQQLLDSIDELQPDQRVYVMFYADAPYLMFNESSPSGLIRATSENKAKLREWVNRIHADGGTQPETPLRMGLDLVPDAIFFLTDGQFDDIVPGITDANVAGTRIHTIAFMNEAGEEQLRRMADENGGTYRFVP